MTRAELKTLMLSWLDDPQGGYFTDANLNAWINNAQKQVQRKLIQSGNLFYGIEVQTNTVVNTNEYALPDDYLRVHKMELIQSGTFPNENRIVLQPVTPMQANFYGTGTGQPGAYYLKQDSFVLLKTPAQVWPIAMLYSYLVEDLTSDLQEPDVPTQYQEMVGVVALMDGFLKDQRNPAPMFQDKLMYYEKLMAQDAQDRNVDVPREVVVTQPDSTFWGF